MANYFAPMKKAITGKNKVAWIIGAVVVFGLIYYALSKGAPQSSSSGGNVIVSGPSDAEIAASMQNTALQTQASVALQTASIEAAGMQRETELAGYVAGLQFENAQTQAANELALATMAINADSANTELAINAELTALSMNNSAGLASQQLNTQIAMEQLHVNENMFISQLENNADMFAAQISSLNFQTLANQIGTIKKKDRDTALAALIAANAGMSFSGGRGDDAFTFGR